MLYLDANATSQLRPVAIAAMVELFSQNAQLGNPSSVHTAGRSARALLQDARREVLELLGFSSSLRHNVQLCFTSGATEGCNSLIYGFLGASQGNTIVSSSIEHPAILEPLKRREFLGDTVIRLDPDSTGLYSAESFVERVPNHAALVVIQAANGETGAVHPVSEIAELLRRRSFGGAIISDFTQALGKLSLDVATVFANGVDGVVFSGHKIGAPRGIGALVLNLGGVVCREFEPLILGGPQEGRFRAGTENLIGAVAFGAVAKQLREIGADERATIRRLRETFYTRLAREISGLERITPSDIASRVTSLPNTLMLGISGVRGDDLVVALDLAGVCASTGSACASGKQSVSDVMRGIGRTDSRAREVVRFSLDWSCTAETIDLAVPKICKAVNEIRAALSPKVVGGVG